MEALCIIVGMLIGKLLKEIVMETFINSMGISEENGTGSQGLLMAG